MNFLWQHGSFDDEGRVAVGQLVLSAVSLAALAVSGYHGGSLAYHYGVRVADETTQGQGYLTGSHSTATRITARPGDGS